MKTKFFAIIFLISFFAVNTNAQNTNANLEQETVAKQKSIKMVQFKVSGMTCAEGCAKGIENALYKLKGVKSSEVDFSKEMATVYYNEAKITKDQLKRAIETFNSNEKKELSYKAEEVKN